MDENIYMLFWEMVPGVGRMTLNRLINSFGSPYAMYKETESVLKEVLTEKQLRSFLLTREQKRPEEIKCQLDKKGIQYYSIFHRDYPDRLKKIEDRPIGLFVKGELPKDNEMTVAVIGTRSNSIYGYEMAREYVHKLVGAKVGIISGMARGIDGIAQKAAVEYGGRTYGVLGCGVDVCYPSENIDLYSQIQKSGGVISEFVPGTRPAPGLFPLRNRIISGLSDIVLVMEAREKSGTLITVDMALEQGREVYVLPGRVTDELSRGCNKLMEQGATPLAPPDEFLEQLIKVNIKGKSTWEVKDEKNTSVSEENWMMKTVILECLSYNEMSMSQLWEKVQIKKRNISLTEMSEILTRLKISGEVHQDFAGRWIKINKK